MALAAWELEQRNRGNTSAAEMAKVLREQYGDIPLSSTPIQPKEITRFTDESRSALEKAGFLVYGLSGQSIRSLREAGKPFWSTWHNAPEYQDFETLPSRLLEVAFNPEQLFLPKSNNKKLAEQLEMVRELSKELKGKRRITGVEAVLGQAPDYVELAFSHLGKSGNRLFGESYNYDYTRTQTTVVSYVASVGSFYPAYGLHVSYWDPDDVHSGLWASPLVVPSETR